MEDLTIEEGNSWALSNKTKIKKLESEVTELGLKILELDNIIYNLQEEINMIRERE